MQMTTAQSIYMVAFSVYLVFFVLFARFFVWKSYSDKKYEPASHTQAATEGRPPRALGRDVHSWRMVPAEWSLVIENTVRHLTRWITRQTALRLSLSPTRRILAAEADRARIASAAVSVLRGQPREPLSKEQEACVRAVLLSILSEYALREYLSKGFQKKYSVSVPELASLPAQERHKMIRDICIAIAGSHGAPPGRSCFLVSRTCGWLSPLIRAGCTPVPGGGGAGDRRAR